MENSNSKIIWILVGIVIVASIIGLVIKGKKEANMSSSENPAAIGETLPEEKKDTQKTATNTGKASVLEGTAGSLSYQQNVEKYKDRRIQFDENCQTYPSVVTYKDATGIMLDNRSSKARTIKVDTSYSVKPYGWRIIMLPDAYRTAKTFLVDCDSSQNVATILVQG
jgi:hypothetical protein